MAREPYLLHGVLIIRVDRSLTPSTVSQLQCETLLGKRRDPSNIVFPSLQTTRDYLKRFVLVIELLLLARILDYPRGSLASPSQSEGRCETLLNTGETPHIESFPSLQTTRDYLELFELDALKGVIFLQSVLGKVCFVRRLWCFLASTAGWSPPQNTRSQHFSPAAS